MPAPTIDPLPTPPSRTETPSTFSNDADDFVAALPTFCNQVNAFGDYLNAYTPSGAYSPGGTDVAVADGGTGASTAAGARSNLGAAASGAIGSSGLTMSTAKLLGRTTTSAGAPEEIAVGSGLSLSEGTLSATSTSNQWTEAKWWDQAVNGSAATVECDVTGATEILIVAYGLTNTSSVQRVVQVSTDGGSTWYTSSGDYNEASSSGAIANNTAFFPHNTASTGARSFTVQILNNGTGRIPVAASMPTRSVTAHFVASTTAINRVRVMGVSGGSPSGTLNGGTIQFLVR